MFAVLYLPDFLLQAALRHEPDAWSRPIALVDPSANVPRVLTATPAARTAGVVDGLNPPQALARCREVALRHRSPAQEAAATDAVVQVAFGFSPNLETTSPGLITLDLRGLVEATHTSALPNWGKRLQQAVQTLGLRVQVGIGATPNLARHAALWSGDVHVVGHAGEFVASLPVAALEPTPHVATILQQWGVRTVGEFLALGQAELSDRLGLEALALFAAASTTALRPLHLIRPAERFEESWDFEHDVETLEPLLFLLRRFVDSFGQRLEALGLAAEHLTLRLRLESGEAKEHRLRLPEPTRQPEALFRTLQTHLESVRTDAPVVGVGLSAEPTRPRQRQFTLFEAAVRDPHQFQETLARLSALVGSDRVGSPLRENSHRPDAFRMVPPDFENAPIPAPEAGAWLHSVTPLRRLRPARAVRVEVRLTSSQPTAPSAASAPFGTHRPTPQLSSEQIAAILSPVFRKETPAPIPPPAPTATPPANTPATEQPVSLSSAGISGRIRRAVGPLRASGGWWESGWSAEEWDVETERGDVVRLVKRAQQWTLEGLGD